MSRTIGEFTLGANQSGTYWISHEPIELMVIIPESEHPGHDHVLHYTTLKVKNYINPETGNPRMKCWIRIENKESEPAHFRLRYDTW